MKKKHSFTAHIFSNVKIKEIFQRVTPESLMDSEKYNLDYSLFADGESERLSPPDFKKVRITVEVVK